MKINELQPRQGRVELEATVIKKGSVREFKKEGTAGKVCTARLQDDTGEIDVTLWNEQIDLVEEGNTVRITNGYVGEWQGEKQLSTGKFGTLEVVEKIVKEASKEHKEKQKHHEEEHEEIPEREQAEQEYGEDGGSDSAPINVDEEEI